MTVRSANDYYWQEDNSNQNRRQSFGNVSSSRSSDRNSNSGNSSNRSGNSSRGGFGKSIR